MRRIIDHPVVYLSDLPDEQREYLVRHKEELVAVARLGLDTRVEVREEGVALADSELSDLVFPATSTASFLALALVDLLAREAASGAEHRVDRTQLLELASTVADIVRPTVPLVDRQPMDAAVVLRLVVPLLEQLGLLDGDGEAWLVRAAAARYRDPSGRGARAGGEALLLFGPDTAQQPADDVEGSNDESA